MRKVLKVIMIISMAVLIAQTPTASFTRGRGRQSVYMPKPPRGTPKGRHAKEKGPRKGHAKGKKGKGRVEAQKSGGVKSPRMDESGLKAERRKSKARKRRRLAKRDNMIPRDQAQSVVCTCVKHCNCSEKTDFDSCNCSRAKLKR